MCCRNSLIQIQHIFSYDSVACDAVLVSAEPHAQTSIVVWVILAMLVCFCCYVSPLLRNTVMAFVVKTIMRKELGPSPYASEVPAEVGTLEFKECDVHCVRVSS